MVVIAGMPAAAVEPSPTGISPEFRDLEYARVDGQSLQLDLYQPKASIDAAPLIIWVHGGAWRSGSKDQMPVGRWLQHGFAIASVDYRLSGAAPFPAQAHDIHSAIRWLRLHSVEYQLDPARFAIAGSSAGGHLAALVGTTSDVAELAGDQNLGVTSEVQGIVSFFGASNLVTILDQSTPHGLSVRVPALQLLLGGQPREKFELARLASPASHVDASDPPLWLVHGDQDPQMPIEQSLELEAAYQRQKLPVIFRVVRGGKHGGEGFFTAEQLDRISLELFPE